MRPGYGAPVDVTFRKTGERRYGVWVERAEAPDVAMNPAPGFDPFLPHDLLHFVAEAQWGIDGAVFGQLAAGGDAGTFHPVEPGVANKWKRRGERLRKESTGGRRSELLADLLERGWHARRSPAALPRGWEEHLTAAGVDRGRFEAVVAGLDELAERWHALEVGGSLTLEWPRRERRPHRRRSRAAI